MPELRNLLPSLRETFVNKPANMFIAKRLTFCIVVVQVILVAFTSAAKEIVNNAQQLTEKRKPFEQSYMRTYKLKQQSREYFSFFFFAAIYLFRY